MNRQRRAATEEATSLVIEQVEAMPSLPAMLVIADESIPQGVAGLAASRLAERYRRPSAVLSVNGDLAVASARSIPEFNIVDAIAASSPLLVRFGGHAQAAGFTVPTRLIGEVTERLNQYAEERLGSLDLSPILEIDSVAALDELSFEVYDWLAALEPYGKGNRRPMFASLNVPVKEARIIGHSRPHLRLRVKQNGREMTALAFNQAHRWAALAGSPGEIRLDLAYTLMLDKWQDQSNLVLRVSEFRPSEMSNRTP